MKKNFEFLGEVAFDEKEQQIVAKRGDKEYSILNLMGWAAAQEFFTEDNKTDISAAENFHLDFGHFIAAVLNKAAEAYVRTQKYNRTVSFFDNVNEKRVDFGFEEIGDYESVCMPTQQLREIDDFKMKVLLVQFITSLNDLGSNVSREEIDMMRLITGK